MDRNSLLITYRNHRYTKYFVFPLEAGLTHRERYRLRRAAACRVILDIGAP